MSQWVNLSVSGIYTSISDYNGLPPGALDVADNVESRYKNVLEPRRGFEGLENSVIDLTSFKRLANFYIAGVSRILGLTSAGDWVYYTGTLGNAWPAVPGDVVTNIMPPNAINGKSRFVAAGQNIYLTAQDGVRSLSSGSSAEALRAGVPKGLNLEAQTNGDLDGFFNNNVVLTTTGDVTSSSATLTNLGDTTGVVVDQYVSGAGIPEGTKVLEIIDSSPILAETGATSVGSSTITNLASIAGLAEGVLVSGSGIPDGAKVLSATGNSATLDSSAYLAATGTLFTFSSPLSITMDQMATGTTADTPITFYSGSQVGYRMLFGRVETDINGINITRLGSPSSLAIATNTSSFSTNVSITGTLPKNSENRITFVQLYRSDQTASIDVSPLDQYKLVYERVLTQADFLARTIVVTDDVPDSLRGIALYSGSDQEGSLQANDPPPMCWDMCKFRDFTLFANVTQPTTLKVTLTGVGAPSGLQLGDSITVSGSFLGVGFSESYLAVTGGENAPLREFQLSTGGTPSQNIADTINSLIRVINYDEDLPVHAILLSTATDLPGQVLLEADNPSFDTFLATASAHADAWDPTLTDVVSEVNTVQNNVAISKSGEIEAVPATNVYPVGDSSSPVLRVIPLRDYIVAIKTDGIYKILGTTPSGLVVNPFDLTTKIIGADTAVSLNSGVWMLSNQGVVSISDGGVDAKSIPIDDQLNRLIGSFIDALTNYSFAVGYESDRKYILAVPESDTAFAQIEYNFNYVTSAWTTWSRNFHTGFVHSSEGKLYVARADSGNEGVSRERKTATYRDYVDEAVENEILSVTGDQIVLDNVSDVEAGDILFQDSTHFSPILEVDLLTNTVTVQYELSFVPGDVEILKAYACTMTWKQVFGDNPAFMRQFSEGIALFKNTRFNTATASFVTDFSQSDAQVELTGTGNALWGLFGWGEVPWGGAVLPSKIRFYIPQDKQLGSYLLPTLTIQQGYSDFRFQGMSIMYFNVSGEVGR